MQTDEWFPTQDSCSPHKPQKSLPQGRNIPQDGISKIPRASDKFKIYLIYTNVKTVKIHSSITRTSKTCNQILARFLCFCILSHLIIMFGDFFIIKHFSKHSNAKPTSDLCLPTMVLTVITLNFIIRCHIFLDKLLYCEDLAKTRSNSDFSWSEWVPRAEDKRVWGPYKYLIKRNKIHFNCDSQWEL